MSYTFKLGSCIKSFQNVNNGEIATHLNIKVNGMRCMIEELFQTSYIKLQFDIFFHLHLVVLIDFDVIALKNTYIHICDANGSLPIDLY